MTSEEKLQTACDVLMQRIASLVVENTNLQVDVVDLRKQVEALTPKEQTPTGEQ